MNLSTFKVLLLREVWENKGLMIKAPMILSAVFLIIFSIGTFQFSSSVREVTNSDTSFSFMSDLMQLDDTQDIWQPGKQEGRRLMKKGVAIVMVSIFLGVLVGHFYCLYSLYNDRKDRSILFWRSLPVSEAENILSKIAISLFGFPLAYMAFSVLILFASLIVLSIGAAIIGVASSTNTVFFYSLLAFPEFVAKAFLIYLCFIPYFFVTCSWLLFCSAISKKNPLLMAIGPYVVIAIFEAVIFHSNVFASTFSAYILTLLKNGAMLVDGRFLDVDWLTYLVSLSCAAALLLATNWLRNNKYEI